MRNKDVLAYLGLWEQFNNQNFKGHEFETFESEAGKHSFYMSPQKWIKETNAELIEMTIPQNERLIKLNNMARKQMKLLKDNKSFNNIEYIENKINKEITYSND